MQDSIIGLQLNISLKLLQDNVNEREGKRNKKTKKSRFKSLDGIYPQFKSQKRSHRQT
jgi:hypothetical protein